ncbi:MAG TPA: AAA family ATPase [Clostridia bacterium]|nr:AAA family ATPase [Clostridia bacterium]
MTKLNMIVADSDDAYLRGITGYMLAKHSERFTISGFTNSQHLNDFLSSGNHKVDILLVSPDIYQEEFQKHKITLIAILSSGRLPQEYRNCEIINKYQLGENLISNVINLFSEKSTEIIVHGGEKKTKVISVFSPIGGSGKTTIAYGCALKYAQNGLKVFYLNFENVPSTAAFFESGTSNLSHILYYLKAKNKNLPLKIEGIKMEDQYSGIHYFAPPARLTDMQDIQPEEYSRLISVMREMSVYDVIIADMSGILEKNNLTVIKESDEVLFVVTPEISSYIKASSVISELEEIYQDGKDNILSRFTIVLNKHFEGAATDIENLKIGGKGIEVKIPKVSPLVTMQYGRAFINTNGIFGEALAAITSRHEA